MDPLIIILRLTHVVLGALWVGIAVFNTFYLGPAFQDAGPDGAKVAAALQRRGMMTVLPIIAVATLISGVWLYWRNSGGFDAGYVTAPIGLAYGLGGLAAIIAYSVGMIVARPAMLRSVVLSQALASAPAEERPARVAEIERLRARAGSLGRIVTFLLLAAVAAMAVARYL